MIYRSLDLWHISRSQSISISMKSSQQVKNISNQLSSEHWAVIARRQRGRARAVTDWRCPWKRLKICSKSTVSSCSHRFLQDMPHFQTQMYQVGQYHQYLSPVCRWFSLIFPYQNNDTCRGLFSSPKSIRIRALPALPNASKVPLPPNRFTAFDVAGKGRKREVYHGILRLYHHKSYLIFHLRFPCKSG